MKPSISRGAGAPVVYHAVPAVLHPEAAAGVGHRQAHHERPYKPWVPAGGVPVSLKEAASLVGVESVQARRQGPRRWQEQAAHRC